MKAFLRIIVCLLLVFGAFIEGKSQVSNSLYFMKGVPQSNRVNPARQPDCNFYFGIPLVSPYSTVLTSSSLSYGDVIYPHPTQDSLITFLHPMGSKEDFLDKLRPLNFVVSEVGSSLFSMGFRNRAGFFSLDITSRLDGSLYFPGDLARLILEGADEGETYNLSGIGADISGFEEVAVGWSGEIGSKLQIGVRGKLLFGLGNLSSTRSEISISPSEEAWNIQTDFELKASLPFAEVRYDDDGIIEEIIIEEDIRDMKPLALAQKAFSKGNIGLGFDVGIDYMPNKRWLLSASILDMGYIMWNDNVHELSYKRDYLYTSRGIDPFEFSDDYTFSDYIDSTLSQIADTLSDALKMGPGEKYARRLNTKIYLGASWLVTPGINLGLLSRTDFLKEAITEQITASANFKAGRFLNFTLSYTYMNNYFKNFGAGISINAGPLNIYAISDNALSVWLWPENVKTGSIWFGLNLILGYRQAVDRPLVY